MVDKRNDRSIEAALLTIVLLLSGALAAQTPSQPQPNPNIPKGMKRYFFCFLVKGEKWAQTPPKEELDQLMKDHLAYIQSQSDAGNYALAGPFLDNDRIRGIAILNAASAEEARSIASADPMVKMGRMAVEIHPALLADVSCVLVEYRKNSAK